MVLAEPALWPFPLALVDDRLAIIGSTTAFRELFGPVNSLAELAAAETEAQAWPLLLARDKGSAWAGLSAVQDRVWEGRLCWARAEAGKAVLFLDRDWAGDTAAFQSLLDALPQAVMILDNQGLVSAWNRTIERLTGVDRSRVIGTAEHARAFNQKFTLADLVLSGRYEKILDTYGPLGIRRADMSEEAFEAERDFQSPDRTEHRLLFHASPIRDDQGRTAGAVETLLDISYRHRLEQALRQSVITYRSLVDSLSEGVAVFNTSGHLLANKAYLKVFGFNEPAEVKSRTFASFIHPDSQREFLTWSRYLGAVPFEGQAIRGNGRSFRLEASINPIIYGDKEAFQVTVRDITPKKKAQQDLIEANRLEASGRLAFEIVHEINNPLNGLLTYARLLGRELELGSEKADILDKMIKQINRCRIVIGGLRDFALQGSEEKKALDPNQIVNDALNLLSGHRLLKNVKLTSSLARDLPPFRGHRAKLEQALLNLLVNAMEAMDGSGELTVITQPGSGGREILIKISDTGPGIPVEKMGRIFEPFFTSKKRYRGTGLGLSISLGIVRKHGGTIGVKTDPQGGTTLTVRLPGVG